MRAKLEPPDGGWGWVVAAASSAIFFLTYSLLVSNGVLMVVLIDTFNTGRAEMAWIPILCFTMARVTAPVSAILSNRLSHRLVALTGGLLISTGYALGFLATNVVHLFLALGITVGIGAGFTILPSSILTTLYFRKRISLANGMYTAGASVGCIGGPMMTQYLVQWMGLRFTFIILAGYALHICIAASLLQPVAWHMKKVVQLPTLDLVVKKTQQPLACKPLRLNNAVKNSLVFLASPADVQEQLQKSKAAVTRMVCRKSSFYSRHSCNGTVLDAAHLEDVIKQRNAWEHHSIRSIRSNSSSQNLDTINRQVSIEVSSLQPVQESNELDNGANETMDVDKKNCNNLNLTDKDEYPEHSPNLACRSSHFERRRSSRLSQILRQASIPTADPTHRLSVQASSMAQNDNIAQNDSDEDDKSRQMPDLSFFKRPVFYMMCITAASFFTTLSVVGIIIPDFVREELEEIVTLDRSAILLATLAASDTTVRFLFSWLWDLPFINKTYCHLCACIVCGSAFASFVFVHTYIMALVCCLLMGLASGISGVLLTVLFRTYLGSEAFGLAFSSASLLSGFFMLGVGSFIGILKDKTGSYRSSFVIIGLITVASALAWLVMELCCKKKIGRRSSYA